MRWGSEGAPQPTRTDPGTQGEEENCTESSQEVKHAGIRMKNERVRIKERREDLARVSGGGEGRTEKMTTGANCAGRGVE